MSPVTSAESAQAPATPAERVARRRPWWVWLIGGVFLLVGAAVVAVGGRISGLSEYERSIFAHVGTAIGLVGPLFVIERLLSIRVTETREEASAARSAAGKALETAMMVQDSVSDLDREVRERLSQIQGEEEQRAQGAAQGRFEDLVALYAQAAARRWIDRRGLRVPAGADLWLRARAVQRAPEGGETIWLIELTYEDPKLGSVASAVWSPDEEAKEVFVRLAGELKQTGRWAGDKAFNPAELLKDIAASLRKVIDSHTGPRGDRGLRQVIELVGDEWAVTREGLDSLDKRDLYAESGELRGNTNPAFQRLLGRVEAEGLDEVTFRIAFANAERIHEALHIEDLKKFGKLSSP